MKTHQQRRAAPGEIRLPKSDLRVAIDEADTIKREMTELLLKLEEAATGRPITKPGGWRHDPRSWAGRH